MSDIEEIEIDNSIIPTEGTASVSKKIKDQKNL